MEKEPILQMGSDKMIPRHVYDKPFTIRFPDRKEVQDKKKKAQAGVYCHRTRRKLSFSLGQYTTVFQAEVYAIKGCAVENLDRDYKNRNI
jgi:hypothetical protein